MAESLLGVLTTEFWDQSKIDYVLHVSKSASEQLEKWLKNKLILEELQRPGAIIRPGILPDVAEFATACLAHKIKQMKETVETNKTDYMGFKVFVKKIEDNLKKYGMTAVEYADYEEVAKKREQVFEEMHRVGQVNLEIRQKIRSVPWVSENGNLGINGQGPTDLVGEISEFAKDAESAQRNFEKFVRSVMKPIYDEITRKEEERRAAQMFFRTPIITELVED